MKDPVTRTLGCIILVLSLLLTVASYIPTDEVPMLARWMGYVGMAIGLWTVWEVRGLREDRSEKK